MDTCQKCGYFRPPNHSTTKDAAGKVIRFLCIDCNYEEEHEARFVEASKFGHDQLAERLIAEVKRRNLKDVKCKGEYEDRYGSSHEPFATAVVVKPLKTRPWKNEIEVYLLLSRDEIIAEMTIWKRGTIAARKVVELWRVPATTPHSEVINRSLEALRSKM